MPVTARGFLCHICKRCVYVSRKRHRKAPVSWRRTYELLVLSTQVIWLRGGGG